MKRQLVEVTWSDAAMSEGAWTSTTDAARCGPVKVRTVGYVLHRDRETIVIAGGLNDADQASGVAVIPRAMVRRIRRLRRG